MDQLLPRGCRWHPTCCGWRQDSYLSPQALLACRVAPAKCQTPRLSCLQEDCPLQASSLLSHLGPAVRMESGQRHFGNTDAYRSYGSAKTTRVTAGVTATLWRPVTSSTMTTVGRPSPSPRGTLCISSTDVPLAPQLCSPGKAAHLRPGRLLKVCRGGVTLGGFTVCPVHAIPSHSEQHCTY